MAVLQRSVGVLAALLLAGGVVFIQPAAAQPAPVRVVGTIETMSGTTLVLKTAEGQDVHVVLPEQARVTALENRTLADIKPGDFVGSAAKLGADGKLHAQEVHIFPEALRGTGEGHRPMAGMDQTMTNATVAGVAAAPDGQVLTLKYPGGEQHILVGPEARIVAFIAGDRGLLKPGAMVAVTADKAEDGDLTARSVQAEKNGVKPLVF
jgi:hypothetical protein